MTHERGASVDDYQAPLFLAWQLTNRCQARCLHCCEQSGPDKAWPDELQRGEALSIARQAVELRIADAAFGGGEPLGVGHVWDLFEILNAGGVAIKIETNGLHIDDAAARRLKDLHVESIQISLDGASARAHERLRPGGEFSNALAAVERLSRLGLGPEIVYVPTKLNQQEAPLIFDLAAKAGARRFVTGPMMRLGRAAEAWDSLALTQEQWQACLGELQERAARHREVELSIYPWDILEEVRVRRLHPQAMMLVVPNGMVKLLNALPFACADLRKVSLADAWKSYLKAWTHPEVVEFTGRILDNPSLLSHANECWPLAS